MENIRTEIQRLTDIINNKKLTSVNALPREIKEELDTIQLNLVKCLSEILISCQEATALLNKKERIVKNYLAEQS